MVKFRGIDISVVSQFDCRRLPEFASSTPSGTDTHAICYLPVYPGSQIWFEYSIDGPHPPKAAYFFKLFLNEQLITTWDCTSKHNYHGKTTYSLHEVSIEHGPSRLQRSAFRFVNHDEEDPGAPNVSNDCIEIRVHRIEHRQRIRSLSHTVDTQIVHKAEGRLRLVNGGILSSSSPQRRYKYQLLDPIDQPYATFRFYYRDYEWLQKSGFLYNPTRSDYSVSSSSMSSSSPVIWHDPESSFIRKELVRSSSTDTVHIHTVEDRSNNETEMLTGFAISDATTADPGHLVIQASPSRTLSHNLQSSAHLPLSDSEDSLRLMTRDSIEDLPSQVPRSPQSQQRLQDHQCQQLSLRSELQDVRMFSPPLPPPPPPSPLAAQSPSRRRLQKTLSTENDDVEVDVVKHSKQAQTLDRKASTSKRSISPFTGAGILRRLWGLNPSSASSSSSSSASASISGIGMETATGM